MKKIYKDRLLKLARHLEGGKLIHRTFDFRVYNTYNTDRGGGYAKDGCGTVGCAIGECPAVFRAWHFGNGKLPVLRGAEQIGPVDSGMLFFGLTHAGYARLFFAQYWMDGVHPVGPAGARLSGAASKEEVAANIRLFVAEKEREEKTK